MFRRKQESSSAQEFDALLDEVIEDFETWVERHQDRLAELREALRER